ncbi:prepilin peptidase [Microbacterium soli]|uniref:prepilin peptidase n=1 Tax=Microbacterium soli TaxID=446075 RepID=UPI0031DB235C
MAPLWALIPLSAALGAVLGWWPLHAWSARSLKNATPGTGIRVLSAVVTAVTFALLAWRFADRAALLPAVLVFAALATVLAVVDLAERRLPNTVILWLIGALAATLVVASALTGLWVQLLWALIGAAAMFGLYLVLALISPRSMGMGDVKLAAPLGLLLGWFGLSAWLIGLLAAFICGGVAAIVMLALRRTSLRGSLPFGPSMLAGTLLAVVLV